MHDKVFPLNLVLKCMRSSSICIWWAEPDRVKLDRSEMDHVEPNQDLCRQIVRCKQDRIEPNQIYLKQSSFLELCPSLIWNSLKKHNILEAGSLLFSGK